jgi:hypothetical protein
MDQQAMANSCPFVFLSMATFMEERGIFTPEWRVQDFSHLSGTKLWIRGRSKVGKIWKKMIGTLIEHLPGDLNFKAMNNCLAFSVMIATEFWTRSVQCFCGMATHIARRIT